jgi:tetratricopeptide (TPR) repeat protein
VPEAIDRCNAILGRADDDPALTAVTETMLALLEAMRGNFDDAHSLRNRADERLAAVGLNVTRAGMQMYSGWIALMAQSPQIALTTVRDAYDLLERIGERHRRATTAAILGRLLFFAGDYTTSERYLDLSAECSSPDDVSTQTTLLGTRARLLASHGHTDRVEDDANRAVAVVSATDYLRLHGDALVDRAAVLSALGKPKAARDDLLAASAIYEKKGIAVSLAATRQLLDATPSVAPVTVSGNR